MADTSQLPTWAVYAVAFGTRASAFSGVMISGLFGRRSAAELEHRSRREAVMRLMRWSAELAMDSDPRRSQLGVEQLVALARSDLLGDAEKLFVDAAVGSVLDNVLGVLEDVEDASDQVEILKESAVPDDGDSLPSVSTKHEGAADD